MCTLCRVKLPMTHAVENLFMYSKNKDEYMTIFLPPTDPSGRPQRTCQSRHPPRPRACRVKCVAQEDGSD